MRLKDAEALGTISGAFGRRNVLPTSHASRLGHWTGVGGARGRTPGLVMMVWSFPHNDLLCESRCQSWLRARDYSQRPIRVMRLRSCRCEMHMFRRDMNRHNPVCKTPAMNRHNSVRKTRENSSFFVFPCWLWVFVVIVHSGP